MPSRHFLAIGVSAGLILVGLSSVSLLGQTDAVPSMNAPPPQQMPVSGMPPAYPSTSDPEFVLPAPAIPAANENVNAGNIDLDHLYKPYGSPEAMAAAHRGPPETTVEQLMMSHESWGWQLLPTGLMYKSYLAGNREPRIGSQLVHERELGWLWDATVGGRVGLLRYGTDNDLWPQGWQVDIEGAAFPRLDLEHEEDLIAADFRAGLLLTTRQGWWEAKFGYYHLSSHLGDEYQLLHPESPRINYSRETIVGGLAVYLNPSLRLYSEVGWAFHEDGGAEPWEFQFGADYSSTEPTGICGAPFFAINAHLRQENDFGGNMNVQTGWQWRGRTGHLFRAGMQYFNGMSDQRQFYTRFEEQIGFGLWYDY